MKKKFIQENLVFIILLIIIILMVFFLGLNKIFDFSILNNIFIGLISSLITSFIIVWHLNKFGQPDIEISPEIAWNYNDKEHRYEYRIKVINKTKYDLINIKCEFQYIKYVDEILEQHKKLNMHQKEVNYLTKYDKNDFHFDYCYRYLILSDLISYEFNNPEKDYFRVIFIVTNSNTDKSKIFFKKYKKNNIKKGSFDTGESFTISIK